MAATPNLVSINLSEVFAGSPFIYSILFFLSCAALAIWLFSIFSLRLSRLMPKNFLPSISQKVLDGQFEEAIALCERDGHFTARVIKVAVHSRAHGLQTILEMMRSEARRCGSVMWQRLSILSDIAQIAPMLGLLGTVIGMFYAFYDMNRSVESIGQVFDGLGVAVGTTVAGLVVAIFAVTLHSTLRFRLTRLLTAVENEALSVAHLIEVAGKAKKKATQPQPELAGL